MPATPDESSPFIGVAVLITDTGYELYLQATDYPEYNDEERHSWDEKLA